MIKLLVALLCCCIISSCNASMTGRYFVVDCNWENQRNLITLCLFKSGTMACEDFVVNGRELAIRALNPVDTPNFVNAAIKAVRATPSEGCNKMDNGYCAFAVVHDRISWIRLL